VATIERIEITLVDLPPKAGAPSPAGATAAGREAEAVVVRVADADGETGTGYACTAGTGGSSVVRLLHDHLAPDLIGRDADMVEDAWRLLLARAVGDGTAGTIASLALAAVDTALWDLRCRRAGLPLHLMAGGARADVPLYEAEGGGLDLTPEELAERAVDARERGLGGFSVAVGKPSVAEDAARLEAARAAVGAGFELMAEAGHAFALDEAARRAWRFEPIDLAWLAEPLPPGDVAGHARLAAGTSLPIAAGRLAPRPLPGGGVPPARRLLVVRPDAACLGGITPWLKCAHLAEAHGLPVCPPGATELHVALACAVPNARWAGHAPQLPEITLTGLAVREGRAIPSDEPGLGIAWDQDAIERRRVNELTLLVD
jgi:L-alanine-DL-glutamate epimerase-like enolase superfamily enzyme